MIDAYLEYWKSYGHGRSTRKEEHRRTSQQLLMSQPCLDYQLIERGLDIIKKSLATSYQDNRDLGHNTLNDGMELDINTYRHFKDVYQPLTLDDLVVFTFFPLKNWFTDFFFHFNFYTFSILIDTHLILTVVESCV